MTVEEFLSDPDRRMYAAMPESDALTEEDALAEADLRDVRFDLASGSAGFLLDLRNALGFRMASVAVVVLRDVVDCSVTGVERFRGRWLADLVMSSRPRVRDNLLSLEIGCLSGMSVAVVAHSAEFFVGDIPGLPEVQPDFVEDDQNAINEGMPAWDKDFDPLWATFIDRHPGGPLL